MYNLEDSHALETKQSEKYGILYKWGKGFFATHEEEQLLRRLEYRHFCAEEVQLVPNCNGYSLYMNIIQIN